jgi:hypothetical protein
VKYDCTSAEYATLASFEGLGLGDRRGEKSCFAIKKGKYMKRFLLILLLCVPFVCNAQTEEKKYYIYSIVSFEGEFTKENFKVYFDDGKEVKRMMDKVRCKICGKVGCMNQEYKEAGGTT